MQFNHVRLWTPLAVSGLSGIVIGLVLAAAGALANVPMGQPA